MIPELQSFSKPWCFAGRKPEPLRGYAWTLGLNESNGITGVQAWKFISFEISKHRKSRLWIRKQGNQKISPSHPEVSWDELETPGFYVSRATGNGYRVPAEALIKGASPVIQQVSAHPSRLVKISDNPFIPLIKARTSAANYDIEPKF